MDICHSGQMDRDYIRDKYAMPMRNTKIFIDQMFSSDGLVRYNQLQGENSL